MGSMKKMKKFFLNIVILTMASLILRGLDMFFTVYISGKIGAEGMGVFQLLLSVYFLFVTLATAGIGITTTRMVAEELALGREVSAVRAVKKCLLYSVVCGTLAAILMILFAPIIAKVWLQGTISVYPLYALSVSLPFIAVCSVLIGYFTAVRRVIKSASGQIFEQVLRIFITVGLLTFFAPKGVDYATFALAFASMLAEGGECLFLYLLYKQDKKQYKKGTEKKGLRKKMLSIALPVGGSTFVRTALNTYKQIMIPIGLKKSGLSVSKALADYGLIRGMAFPVLLFPSALLAAISSLMVPEVAGEVVQQHSKKLESMIARIFKLTLFFAILVTGIFFTFADDISLMIYKNTDVAPFLRLLSPLIAIMYLDGIVDALLKGLNEQVNVVKINIIDTLASIALLYTLLPMLGLKGYIIVLFVSECLNGFLSVYHLMKVSEVPFRYFEWMILPGGLAALGILLARLLLPGQFIAGVLFIILVYFGVLWLLGQIKKEDFHISGDS